VSDATIEAYIKYTEIAHLPGDFELRSNSAKLCFFVDNKEKFLPILEKKLQKINEKETPSLSPFETVKNEMSDEELKSWKELNSLIGILKDNMTTEDIINF
jgi:hypothetical protein